MEKRQEDAFWETIKALDEVTYSHHLRGGSFLGSTN